MDVLQELNASLAQTAELNLPTGERWRFGRAYSMYIFHVDVCV